MGWNKEVLMGFLILLLLHRITWWNM